MADVTLLNSHNIIHNVNDLYAAHYFTDTQSLRATTKSNGGTFVTTASGSIWLDISTPLFLN